MIKGLAHKVKLGEFSGSQLIYDNRSITPRIPSTCDEAKESEYEVWHEGHIWMFFTFKTRYAIFCKNCGERLELDESEYRKVKKIIKLNLMLADKNVCKEEYDTKLEQIKIKLLK